VYDDDDDNSDGQEGGVLTWCYCSTGRDEWNNADPCVGCDGVCGGWFHLECLEAHMGITLSEQEAELVQYWYCPAEACQAKIQENGHNEAVEEEKQKSKANAPRKPVRLDLAMQRVTGNDKSSSSSSSSNSDNSSSSSSSSASAAASVAAADVTAAVVAPRVSGRKRRAPLGDPET
jgi:hypothetical protein